MSLKGVLCDDPQHYGEKYTFDACKLCAKEGGPRSCHNSYQLINAMSRNSVDRKDAGLSATMVTNKCPRQTILQEEEDYWEHPYDMYARVRGTVHHTFIEQYSDGLEPYIGEVRFKKSLVISGQEFEITGKPDMILPERKLIIDYKSIKDVYSKYLQLSEGKAVESHVQQVNIYRWLLWGGVAMPTDAQKLEGIKEEQYFVDIEFGGIQYLDMMTQLKCSVPIWPLEDTEAFIIQQLEPLVNYKNTGELPPILYEYGKRARICNYCPVREACDNRG